jgi:hypothetical protein
VDIIGGSSSAHYVANHKESGGIIFPTQRRVYAYGPDNKPFFDRVAVTLDFSEIKVE